MRGPHPDKFFIDMNSNVFAKHDMHYTFLFARYLMFADSWLDERGRSMMIHGP